MNTRARAALQLEEDHLGEGFDETGLSVVPVEAVLAAEMSSVLALWLKDGGQQEAADSFALCSSALRSAVWLWHEDDDRAMGCLRVLIEQMARVRTWRMKPNVAERLDARTETTPRDWVEKCGWRRLRGLLRALGEYVHGANSDLWEGARDVLAALNPHADKDVAKMTGRTNALVDLIVMLNGEYAAWLETIDAT